MRSKVHGVLLSVIFGGLGLMQAVTASDPGPQLLSGRLKADQVCANCHGLDGQASSGGNSAFSPSLTAQPKAYLVAKLNDYREGKIEHPQMTLVARMISQQDIEDVALWYSNLKFTVSAAASDSENVARHNLVSNQVRQVCSHCHGMDGRAVSTTDSMITPHLTGQHKEHLAGRLRDYRSGKIHHQMMSPIAQTLSDHDIQQLAEWYSNIKIQVEDLN